MNDKSAQQFADKLENRASNMSKREAFAMAAMQGFCANMGPDQINAPNAVYMARAIADMMCASLKESA